MSRVIHGAHNVVDENLLYLSKLYSCASFF